MTAFVEDVQSALSVIRNGRDRDEFFLNSEGALETWPTERELLDNVLGALLPIEGSFDEYGRGNLDEWSRGRNEMRQEMLDAIHGALSIEISEVAK